MIVGSVRTDEFKHLLQASNNTSLSVIVVQDSPVPALHGFRAALFAAYFCLFVIGLAGNAWVICVVSVVMRLPRTEAPRPFQIFILALCICDLLVLIFLSVLLADFINGEWAFQSRLLCRLYLCSESLNKFCAPVLLAALSGFCYVNLKSEIGLSRQDSTNRRRSSASSNSMVFRRWCGSGNSVSAVIVVSICLGFGIVSMTPLYAYSDLFHLLLHNSSHVMVLSTKCAFHPPDHVMTAFTIYSFVGGYVIPAASFTFFYCAILAQVHRQHSTSSARYGHPDTVPSYFWRLVRTTLGLVIFYLVCWTPYWTMTLTQSFLSSDRPNPALIMVGYFVHMLPYINSTGHPILYTLLNKALQNDFEKVKTRLILARRRKSEMASSIAGSAGSSRRMTIASVRSQRSGSGTSSMVALLSLKGGECPKSAWLIWRNPHIALDGKESYGTFSFSQATMGSPMEECWTPTSTGERSFALARDSV